MSEDILLPVFLNGARDYVQGTQIISRLAGTIGDGSAVTLHSVDFHKITDRVILAAERDATKPEKESGDVLGRVVFVAAQQQRRFVLLQGAEIAPRKSIVENAKWHELTDLRKGRLTTTYAIDNLQTDEDFLISVVQTLKILHEALADDVSDVWLTGMRASSIPMGCAFPVSSGDLTITENRVMRRGSQWQSMCTAELSGQDGTVIASVAVSFAFKTEGEIHAD